MAAQARTRTELGCCRNSYGEDNRDVSPCSTSEANKEDYFSEKNTFTTRLPSQTLTLTTVSSNKSKSNTLLGSISSAGTGTASTSMSVTNALLPPEVSGYKEDCVHRMENCTEMVRPFLHDLEYMFPTNIQHVDNMCKMWSGFVDCIRLYVKDCATEDQRSRFNDAIGDSIDTVHAICSSEKYQKEYLQSASCFRKVSVDNCGSHYNDMVDEVGNTAANNDNICCSYTKFRSCVSEPLLRLCGSRARTIMDHSMAFLIQRCSSSSFSLSYECPRSRLYSNTVQAASSRSSASSSFSSTITGPSTIIESQRVQSTSRAHRPSSASSSRLLRSEDESSASVSTFDQKRDIILLMATSIGTTIAITLLTALMTEN